MARVLPRFDFRVDLGAHSEQGDVRRRQEDASLLAPDVSLFALADGMGGQPAGDVASRVAVETVRDVLGARRAGQVADAYLARPGLESRRRVLAGVRHAVRRAHAAVLEAGLADQSRRGMGTTLDLVWLVRRQAFVAHVGDGRVYLARSTAVIQLTQDHVASETLKKDGKLSPHTRTSGDGFSRLTGALGGATEPTVDTLHVGLAQGDRLLLTSDGVHGPLGDEARLGALLRAGSAEVAAKGLVTVAAERGRDNASAIVIALGECIVRRDQDDGGLSSSDLERVRQSPLLVDLPLPAVLEALAAAVEVELAAGALVPRVVASDLVAYVVLDGVIEHADGRRVGTGALLFAESLASIWSDGPLPAVSDRARLLRLRADDFGEVTSGNPRLGRELFWRVAVHLARAVAAGNVST